MADFDDLKQETPRLILRPPRAEDLDVWTEMPFADDRIDLWGQTREEWDRRHR